MFGIYFCAFIIITGTFNFLWRSSLKLLNLAYQFCLCYLCSFLCKRTCLEWTRVSTNEVRSREYFWNNLFKYRKVQMPTIYLSLWWNLKLKSSMVKLRQNLNSGLTIFVFILFLLHCRLMISFQHLANWRLLASRDPCRIEGLSWPILQEHPQPHFQHHPLLEDLFGSWKIEISRDKIHFG